MSAGTATRLLLVDANVLIDYVKSEPSILGLVARYLGEVYVLSTVLDEVDGLDMRNCEKLGLQVVEPELTQFEAAAQKRGMLSTADHLCLILAQERGWVCVTNDSALRKACQQSSVPALWGLELMLELARLGQISAKEAIAVVDTIHLTNPFHITDTIVSRFKAKLREINERK